MSDKVIIVTPPDDIQVDGLRILLVDLTPDQTNIISQSLTRLETIPTTITYVWNTSNDISWLLDKKHKSFLIFFNADSENDAIIGYMAAQANSYYFGNLKSLSQVNQNAIYDTEQIFNLMENVIQQYVRQLR
jgi:hypothetical protein